MFVTIYGRLSCPYCIRAKSLAEKLTNELEGFNFEFVDMIAEDISKEYLAQKLNKPVQTVPQVVVDGKAIGGCTDFEAFVRDEFNIV